MINFLLFSLSLFFLSFVYGCSPAGIIASGGATTMVIAEGDRSLGTVIDDTTIKINIAQKFLNSENNLFLSIEIKVIEGRVLLTGIVDNQELRINAIQRVWEVNGVKEVINEIQIGDKTTLKEYANDLWINTQIKALAAKNIGLRVLSYNFETIRGKVYIAGITSRPEQLDIVIQSARKVKGVKEIVNYVLIKEDLSD
jgi:osmotically-inducible protein OsmY|tara:strand:+ start:1727 stop:2320 length:594 start_codon:yes stop_codon:yes gene_type:complete